ncbi:MAG: hypothetical protein ACLPZJ_09540 [Terriglobales bacterium]
MNLETAMGLLRAIGGEVKEVNGGFIFKVFDQQYLIKKDELNCYLERKSALRKNTETQLWYPGYYEHVVQFEGIAPKRLIRRGNEDVLSVKSSDGTVIEIGRPSPLFCISLTDADEMHKELRRFALRPIYRSEPGPRSLSDLFRLYTIKVATAPDTSLGRNPSRMHELAEAAIFHFAFGKGLPISFTKSWERTYYWLGRKDSEEVQFPLRIYISELVSYYNLALATDSLVLGYLALYKVLEYFFTSVSENALHQKVREQLVAPDFAHTKAKKLRELVKAIGQFDMRSDELEALKLVLSAYFEKAGLRRWVEEYERTNGLYFTKEVEVFNSKMKIDLSDNTVIPNIATRIYTIRNALVHNKEGEISRFIPYTGQEETLHREVQILVHLAEQLIIKSGKDIV